MSKSECLVAYSKGGGACVVHNAMQYAQESTSVYHGFLTTAFHYTTNEQFKGARFPGGAVTCKLHDSLTTHQ